MRGRDRGETGAPGRGSSVQLVPRHRPAGAAPDRRRQAPRPGRLPRGARRIRASGAFEALLAARVRSRLRGPRLVALRVRGRMGRHARSDRSDAEASPDYGGAISSSVIVITSGSWSADAATATVPLSGPSAYGISASQRPVGSTPALTVVQAVGQIHHMD